LARHECNPDDKALSGLVDDDLPERERRRVAQHVLACPTCSRETGRLLAVKRLLARPELDAEPPLELWDETRRRLDEVDGLRARVSWVPPQARRLVAIAAVGIIMVSSAVILKTAVLSSVSSPALLVQAHERLTEGAWAAGAPGGAYSAVSVTPSAISWRPVRRALLKLDGTLISQTVFQVGRCPVSLFEGPAEWHPFSHGDAAAKLPNGLEVGTGGDTSLVSWEAGGVRWALVARTTPADLVELAQLRRSLPGRSPGL